MPATPLTDAIQALTTYANTVTSASDTTLSAAVGTLVDGYGGGSSLISLLDTITVPADTRTVDLDLTPYQNYDLMYVVEDVTLNSQDWLYYVPNGTEPSGGSYSNGNPISHKGIIYGKAVMSPNEYSTGFMIASSANHIQASVSNYNNLFIYTHNASNAIKAGSTFKIYAGNYSEL